MPRLSWKNLLAIFALLVGLAFIISLPSLRARRWEHTQVSTRQQIPVKTQEELDEEIAVEKATAVDESKFTPSLGIRYIRRIPTSKIELEAAFRQRRTEASMMLPPSDPLLLTRFSRDPKTIGQTKNSSRLLTTRRPVFSIGLEMRDTDIAQLPWLSRSTIVNFIKEHFVSLQAQVLKDEANGEYYLHHRPIAGVAKFGSAPITHSFVSPITETVADIRGLGVFLGRDDDQTKSVSTEQTAVWLFRSQRLIESVPSTHYDYAFVRFSGRDLDPTEFSVILTTNNRSEWHCLSDSEGSHLPARGSETSTLGSVHFLEYASDGLHPKTSATRSIRIKAKKVYSLNEIIAHLAKNGIDGEWGQHLSTVLDFVFPKAE